LYIEDASGSAFRLVRVEGVGESLTVFIDGPSGFTYVYNQEGGSKFVGKLVDRRD